MLHKKERVEIKLLTVLVLRTSSRLNIYFIVFYQDVILYFKINLAFFVVLNLNFMK